MHPWRFPSLANPGRLAPKLRLLMNARSIRYRLLFTVLLAGVLPMMAGHGLALLLGHSQIVHERLHGAMEFTGACVALVVAMLLLVRARYDKESAHLIWIVAGLLAMGVFDSLHAIVPQAPAWSWLRHVSTLLGGVFYAMVWLPVPAAVVKRRRVFISGFFLVITGLAAAVWVWRGALPFPWAAGDHTYTLPVKLANSLGGLGFLAASGFFLRRFSRRYQGEDLVFASQAMLFSAAGLVFGFSSTWALDWWSWHVFRLLAYGVVLLATYNGVTALYHGIARHSNELEEEVRARTAELRSIAAFPLENPSPVFRSALDGTLLFANRASEEMLAEAGCKVGEALPEALRGNIPLALESGKTCNLEFAAGNRVVLFSIIAIPQRNYVNFYGIDISELKRVEDSLRDRERELQLLTDTVPALISYIDRKQRYRFVNRQYETWFGCRKEDVLGKTMAEVLGETAVERLSPYIEQASQGQTVHFEVEVPYQDGGTRWIQAYYVPDRLADDRVQGFYVLVLDVTDRKRAEGELRKQTERQALLLEATSALVGAGQDEATITKLVFERVTGPLEADVCFNYRLDTEENTLRLVAGFGIPPDKWEASQRLALGEAFCGTVATTCAPFSADLKTVMGDERGAFVRAMGVRAYAAHPLMARDGRLLGTFSLASTLRDEFTKGEIEFLQTLCHYIALAWERLGTERALRLADQRLQYHIQNTPLGVVEFDADLHVIAWSDGAERIFGWEASEVVGKGVWEVPWVPIEDLEKVQKVAAGLQSGESLRSVSSNRNLRKDGRVIWCEWYNSSLVDACGKTQSVQSLVLDVTERRLAELALQEAQEELQQHALSLEQVVRERTAKLQELVAELEHFSYTITHDMRAPLRSMRGFSELAHDLCGNPPQPELQSFLRRIITSAERMDLLITDALSYSKAVRQEVTITPVDVGALLRGMLDSYPEFQTSRARIQLESGIHPVMGNEAALTQCFSNLLGNAVKFVAPGQAPDIQIWGERRQGWVRIHVEDKGIGISPQMLPRVFEMFSRGINAGTYEGTGIGLALVRKVVKRMGGEVGVESELGKGSRFWVELIAAEAGDMDDVPR